MNQRAKAKLVLSITPDTSALLAYPVEPSKLRAGPRMPLTQLAPPLRVRSALPAASAAVVPLPSFRLQYPTLPAVTLLGSPGYAVKEVQLEQE